MNNEANNHLKGKLSEKTTKLQKGDRPIQVCSRGLCENESNPLPVDSGWGTWLEWSDCSRTVGVGCSVVHASATTLCEEENERVGHDSSVIPHVVVLGPRASLVSSLSL